MWRNQLPKSPLFNETPETSLKFWYYERPCMGGVERLLLVVSESVLKRSWILDFWEHWGLWLFILCWFPCRALRFYAIIYRWNVGWAMVTRWEFLGRTRQLNLEKKRWVAFKCNGVIHWKSSTCFLWCMEVGPLSTVYRFTTPEIVILRTCFQTDISTIKVTQRLTINIPSSKNTRSYDTSYCLYWMMCAFYQVYILDIKKTTHPLNTFHCDQFQ